AGWKDAQDQAARMEMRDLQQRYRQNAESAEAEARKAYRDAYDVIKNHPSRRRPEDKERASEALSKAQGDLEQAIAKISAGPAYRKPDVEELRQGIIEYLQAEDRLLAIGEKLLRENQNLIGANEKALQEREGRVNQLRLRFFTKQD